MILAITKKLATLIALATCATTGVVSAQDSRELEFKYQTPALIIDDDWFLTLDSKGFRSGDRFLQN